MVEYKTIQVESIYKITCDKCGYEQTDDDMGGINSIISIRHECGYGTQEYNDGDRLEIDICLKCLKEAFGEYIKIDEKRYY